MLTILHAVPDSDDPFAIVAQVMDAVPSGSYLAISHAASDLIDPDALQGLYDSLNGKARQEFQWRTREQVARFFAGMDLVDPGLVRVDDWRPEPGADAMRKSAMWAAAGRKR
jgi:hypothetical protein